MIFIVLILAFNKKGCGYASLALMRLNLRPSQQVSTRLEHEDTKLRYVHSSFGIFIGREVNRPHAPGETRGHKIDLMKSSLTHQ